MLARLTNSVVGMKFVMALSGLAMVGFLVAHLTGNLLVFVGPQAMEAYARGLRDILPLLWLLRIVMILSIILHFYSGIRLSILSKQARPSAYVKKTNVKSTFSSRYMLLSGLVILSFLSYHLAHLTFRVTHAEFSNLGPFDVYRMLIISFSSPLLAFFYSLSIILLMLHLNHGVTSMFQSLGLNHSSYNRLISLLGPGLSIILGLGFLSIPMAIVFGFIG